MRRFAKIIHIQSRRPDGPSFEALLLLATALPNVSSLPGCIPAEEMKFVLSQICSPKVGNNVCVSTDCTSLWRICPCNRAKLCFYVCSIKLRAKSSSLKISYKTCILSVFTIVYCQEAEEMLEVVDRNGDGVISFSEFRCMMGANPILL